MINFFIFTVTQRWSDKEIKLLIELFRENHEKLQDRKYKAKSVYLEMANHFERFTAEQVENKIKNIKKTYKSILDNNSKSGRGKITWPYFHIIDEILGNKPENSPLSIASNRSGFEKKNVESEHSTETSQHYPVDAEPGPSRVTNENKAHSSNTKKQSQPDWLKELRQDMARHHEERMEKQQEFLNLFKEWISKSKES